MSIFNTKLFLDNSTKQVFDLPTYENCTPFRTINQYKTLFSKTTPIPLTYTEINNEDTWLISQAIEHYLLNNEKSIIGIARGTKPQFTTSKLTLAGPSYSDKITLDTGTEYDKVSDVYSLYYDYTNHRISISLAGFEYYESNTTTINYTDITHVQEAIPYSKYIIIPSTGDAYPDKACLLLNMQAAGGAGGSRYYGNNCGGAGGGSGAFASIIIQLLHNNDSYDYAYLSIGVNGQAIAESSTKAEFEAFSTAKNTTLAYGKPYEINVSGISNKWYIMCPGGCYGESGCGNVQYRAGGSGGASPTIQNDSKSTIIYTVNQDYCIAGYSGGDITSDGTESDGISSNSRSILATKHAGVEDSDYTGVNILNLTALAGGTKGFSKTTGLTGGAGGGASVFGSGGNGGIYYGFNNHTRPTAGGIGAGGGGTYGGGIMESAEKSLGGDGGIAQVDIYYDATCTLNTSNSTVDSSSSTTNSSDTSDSSSSTHVIGGGSSSDTSPTIKD